MSFKSFYFNIDSFQGMNFLFSSNRCHGALKLPFNSSGVGSPWEFARKTY